MFYLGRPAGGRDELRDPGLAGISIENPDEHGSVKSGICCEPLVDVAVTSQPDLGLVAIGELWCQRNPSVVDWLRRLIGAVKKG